MRQFDSKNQIWFEKNEQVTQIGFTQPFLNSLDQCWHILPANLEQFKEKSPLLTIETNDALISIVSPVKGSFMEFSHKAQNFPNKLTENDVVLSLRDGPVARAPRQEVRANDDPLAPAPRAAIGGGRNRHEQLMEQIRMQQEALRVRDQVRVQPNNVMAAINPWGRNVVDRFDIDDIGGN